MKKGLSWFLSLIMVFGILTVVRITVNAASESNLKFTLSRDGTYYTVASYSTYLSGRLVIPSSYNGKPVTQIDSKAFENCDNLELVYIPDSVTSIGDRAFYSCVGLTSVTIPDSVTRIGKSAFEYCDNIGSVTIGNSVTSIPAYAFSHCINLNSIAIGNSVTSIGNNAFQYCRRISNVYITDIAAWCNVIFEGDYSHPFWYHDSLDDIWGYKNSLYINGELVKDIVIPDGVTSIGDQAFDSCSGLTSITIPDSVTSIGDRAFASCTSLTSITIPDSVTSIGDVAFASCSGLTSITIPDSVTSIGDRAFAYCTSLTSITIPDSVTNIGSYAFIDCQNLKYVFYSGDQEDWLTIDIGSDNSKLIYANIHYESSGHITSAWEIDAVATCTKNGLKSKTCSICDYVETEYIPAIGHKASSWITDTKSTVNSAGKKHRECTVCEEILETAEISQLKCSKPFLKKVYNANSYVKVTWGTVKGADIYRVYRKTGTGDYECIGSTTNTYFNDKEAGAGKTCRYRIRAKNEAGYSEYSASIAIKHIDEPTLKSIENSAYGVLIKWGKVTGAQKYSVYRKVSGGQYKYIGATSNTYYTDKTAKSGKKYYYAIRGKRDDSVSSQSASLSKYYLADPTLKTPSSTISGIKLSWSKVTGAEGYIIYRKTGSGSYTKIKTEKGVSNLSYTDSSAKNGKKYIYKVKAYKSKTYSACSNAKAITDKY